MANEAGIWRLLLTTRNEIPAAVEKDIAALNRLERKSVQSGNTMQRALGKAGSAIGLGGALEGGGGLRGTLGIGLAVAVGAGFRSVAREAMEADLAAQNAAAAIRTQYRMSEAAAASLNEINLSGVKATTVFKSALGELVATLVASARYLGAAGLNVGASLGRMMGIDMGPTESVIGGILERYFANAPTWMGGIGGLGEGGVASAEKMLADARKERAEADAKRKGTAPERRASSPFQVDDYARLGLFIGGRSTAAETTQLLRDQKRLLELVNRGIEQLAPRIADHL